MSCEASHFYKILIIRISLGAMPPGCKSLRWLKLMKKKFSPAPTPKNDLHSWKNIESKISAFSVEGNICSWSLIQKLRREFIKTAEKIHYALLVISVIIHPWFETKCGKYSLFYDYEHTLSIDKLNSLNQLTFVYKTHCRKLHLKLEIKIV